MNQALEPTTAQHDADRVLFHQYILEGDTPEANMIVHLFSGQELRTEKIGGKWALHCLPYKAFRDKDKISHTQELIVKFIEAGWDVNVETAEKMTLSGGSLVRLRGSKLDENAVTFSNFTLLHLACCYGTRDIVSLLVERGAADVNNLTGGNGNVRLSPLHISAICDDWESTSLLVHWGSDRNSQGFVNIPGFHFSRVIRAEDENGEGAGTPGFTAIQIVLQRGWRLGASGSCGTLLERMLQGRERTTVAELHVAMVGGSPFMVSKILQRLPAEDVTMEELQWVRLRSDEGGANTKIVPSFSFFLDNFDKRCNDWYASGHAADLLGDLVDRGYDCNLGEQGLIFDILDMVEDLMDVILRNLLQFDHVSLHVRNAARIHGKTPVECALPGPEWRWGDAGGCVDCIIYRKVWSGDTVILLIQHGADVANWVFRPTFHYHKVHEELFKVLYSAGAKIDQEFLQNEDKSSICSCGDEEHEDKASADLEELRKWIGEKELVDKLSLQFKARIAVRKLLTSVGHLRLLDGLPLDVKDEVLCKKFE